ncbi:MAG: SUMF1/EgtB/PvdO family nonheme iron enzyme [Verrucomicrobiales bacterium]
MLCRARYSPDGSRWITLMVKPEGFHDEEHREAFVENMIQVAEVEHEGLLAIAGVDRSGDWIAVVYEDFSGSPLFDRMDERIEPAKAVKIVGKAADAVHAAHQAGFVHCDIHPGWILVDEQEGGEMEVKLAAVGIVQALFASDAELLQSMIHRPVQLRCYLAPEQLVPSEPSDFRSDIYTLGAITYHLLVGKTPGGFTVLPSSRADVNRGTDDIVLCAMHTDREKRYGSAASFAEQVKMVGTGNKNDPLAGLRYMRKQQEEGVAGSTTGPKRLVPAIVLILLLSTLSIGAVMAVQFLMKHEEPVVSSDGSGPAKTLAAEQAKELKQVRELMDKGDKEAAVAIAAAMVRSSVRAGQKAMDPAALEAAVLMSVEAGDADVALDLSAIKIPKATNKADAVDWRRVEALTKQLEVGTKGYKEAMHKADEARRTGDFSRERMELAKATGFLPEHPGAKYRANFARQDYDPWKDLEKRLARAEMEDGTVPEFSIHERDAELRLDLSNNPALTDVSMLNGMPVTHLNLSNTAVSDLSPLRGMPLQELYLDHTRVTDLSPLEGTALRILSAHGIAPTGGGKILDSPMLESAHIGGTDSATNRILPPKPGRGWLNRTGLRFDPVLVGGTILFSHWEVRRSDFRKYVEATATQVPEGMITLLSNETWGPIENISWDKPPFEQQDDHPVIGINHRDAESFCKWLTNRDRAAGEIGPQAFYRLPTSSEWSVAAGILTGTNRKVYAWGTEWPATELTENFPHQIKRNVQGKWLDYHDGYAATSPVGSFRGSRIADLGGNVREWCQDEIAGSDANTLHVVRGGAWGLDMHQSDSYKTIMRLDREDLLSADAQWSNLGFRVILDLGLGY